MSGGSGHVVSLGSRPTNKLTRPLTSLGTGLWDWDGTAGLKIGPHSGPLPADWERVKDSGPGHWDWDGTRRPSGIQNLDALPLATALLAGFPGGQSVHGVEPRQAVAPHVEVAQIARGRLHENKR
jgi:hypothetical protein